MKENLSAFGKGEDKVEAGSTFNSSFSAGRF